MIVAIARELGAGSQQIGDRVAAALGAELLDKQIVDLVAAKIGAPASYVEAHDEHVESFVDRLFRVITAAYPEAYAAENMPDWSEERLVALTASIIQERAQRQSLVVIGRGAPFLLKDRADVLRVFVTAPFNVRQRRLSEHRGYTVDEATRELKKSDQQRAAYMMQHYRVDWRDPSGYDLVVNTGRLSIDEAARLIGEAAQSLRQPA